MAAWRVPAGVRGAARRRRDAELIAARAGGVTVLAAEGLPADAGLFRPALDGRPWLADALAAGAEIVTFW